jgi:Flp pilus assembly protein TadD
LKTQPDNATYHYHLGLAYQKMSDAVKAKTHLERSLQLAPNSPDSADVRKALNEITRG